MAYDSRALTGVGGWLAFFVLSLAVFSPIRTAIEVYGFIAVTPTDGPGGNAITVIVLGEAIVSTMIAWYLAWRLVYRQVPETVRIVIIGLWVSLCVPTIIALVAMSLVAGVPFGQLIAGTGPDMVRPAIYSIIWTAYLLRSERVANTYTPESETDELAETFA